MAAFREIPPEKRRNWMQQSDILVAIGVMIVVIMMIVPLPAIFLDVLLAVSLMSGLVVLLIVMYTNRASEFNVFPSLLLVVTVFRLALNVSTTRMILTKGSSLNVQLIRGFGEFVVSGNYVIGFIVFLIIIAVQFIVITRGSTRISEVAARFTLDAMPGKQMGIDADLNAGLIDEREAIKRRNEIRRDADFYGAMDGATKFVRGDVTVGLIITIVNILGGMILGIMRAEGTVPEILRIYALFTIGDGLLSQIPALLISTATGILVTKAESDSTLGDDFIKQMTSHPRVLWIGAGFLIFLALIPGFPKLPLIFLGLLVGFFALRRTRGLQVEEEEKRIEEARRESEKRAEPEQVADMIQVDPLELEIGYSLVPFVDADQGGDLLDRITKIRRQSALEMGLLVPPIRIRDNVKLEPSEYSVLVKGVTVGKGNIKIGKFLAMESGEVTDEIEGETTTEPAFGLPALWINDSERDRAELAGYTVVDPPTVIATHLTEVIKRYSYELLGREQVQSLLNSLKHSYPTVIDEVQKTSSIGNVQKILQNLLEEQVAIRDMITILETISDYTEKVKDLDQLTEYVRQSLKRQICSKYKTSKNELNVITFAPEVEDVLSTSLQETDEGPILAVEPGILRSVLNKTKDVLNSVTKNGIPVVLIAPQEIRGAYRRIASRVIPNLTVLAFNEIIPGIKINNLGIIELQ